MVIGDGLGLTEMLQLGTSGKVVWSGSSIISMGQRPGAPPTSSSVVGSGRNLFGAPRSLRGTDTPDFLNVRFGQKLPVELRPREAGHPRLLGQARGV